MKTTSITVERNFHIMNDDRFIMEKLSITMEVEEHHTQTVIDHARKTIEENFKAAYPKVYTHLNFEPEPIQVNPEYAHHLNGNKPITEPIRLASISYPNPIPSTEKIKQIPIEEQIEACTTLKELKEFELLSKMNKKLHNIYLAKDAEISSNDVIKATP